MFRRKSDVDENVSTLCEFRSAGATVAAIGLNDDLIVKLNCEGGEVEIIDDLIDRDMLDAIGHMLIDFDIRKVPGFELEAMRALDRLAQARFDRYLLAEDVMVGVTHQERIRAWLDGALVGA